MQVARWGNSLAVRIPKSVVDEFGLKEGDKLDVRWSRGAVDLSRDERRAAIERIRQMAKPLPPSYKFDRDEANSR